jgi:uncharacterized protein YraI
MGKKMFSFFTVILILLSACTPARTGGIVQGVVYGDLNSDGIIDESEQLSRVDGAEVVLTGCGPARSQLTDIDGNFRFEDLPEGSCLVSVSKGGWIYDGSFPDLGEYPIPVASDPDLPTAFSIYMAPVMDYIPEDATPTMVATPTETYTATTPPPMVTPDSVDVNCRYGPDTTYLSTGSLRIGEEVLITGTIADHSWWQIEDPRNPGTFCWVKASLTIATGAISSVPIVPIPPGLVIAVDITTPAVVHGYCGGPNATTFEVSIATNGPASVVYHLEIFNEDGSLRNSTADATLNFPAFGTQTFDPGGAYKTDCGLYYVMVFVTVPNSMGARADWSVVSP